MAAWEIRSIGTGGQQLQRDAAATAQDQQGTRASVLRSLIGRGHKRTKSDSTSLERETCASGGDQIGKTATKRQGRPESYHPSTTSQPQDHWWQQQHQPLGETDQNQKDGVQASTIASRAGSQEQKQRRGAAKSPGLGALSVRLGKAVAAPNENKETGSPTKAKKTRSATNLVGLLRRPKSSKSLHEAAARHEAQKEQNKENRQPAARIWAQFASHDGSASRREDGVVPKTRPKSYHQHDGMSERRQATRPSWKKGDSGGSSGEASAADMDRRLEALLDRRNIPEKQRYKMRALTDTIKLEFIRQDWAETRAQTSDDGEGGRDDGLNGNERDRRRRLGGRSKKTGSSATPSPAKGGKCGGDSRARRRSTDGAAGNETRAAQQGPGSFVDYLAKTQEPAAVEVGRLHKLRLLLRNETVAWTDEFVRLGGMGETVALLHRIVAVEWREDHEDALLHENLLCLKALCTTALARQHLHAMHGSLLPALVHMILDDDKKGPSEFATRNIITSLLLTYVAAAPDTDRPRRAATVLALLRDPQPRDDERPVGFVLAMRRERPYRAWCKEVVSVTKEVFWIFLHNLNVVPAPTPRQPDPDGLVFAQRHFPRERAPVPAAPYVGGVEWDATNYLASHLDLLNALVACAGPAAVDRNALRAQLRVSGWERVMGASLRLCKDKFYGAVHDGLRTWVAAAAEDGWDVRDVRFGPPPPNSAPKRKAAAGSISNNNVNDYKTKDHDAAPRIDMPSLDVALQDAAAVSEAWLS